MYEIKKHDDKLETTTKFPILQILVVNKQYGKAGEGFWIKYKELGYSDVTADRQDELEKQIDKIINLNEAQIKILKKTISEK